MGQLQNKYHIADDGSVYKVNEDGSFTSMGNVEVLTKVRGCASKDKSHNVWKILAILFIIISCCTSYGWWDCMMKSRVYEEYYNAAINNYEEDDACEVDDACEEAAPYKVDDACEEAAAYEVEAACEEAAAYEEIAAYEETYEGAYYYE